MSDEAKILVDRTNEMGTDGWLNREDLLDRIAHFECDHERVTGFLEQLFELLEMIAI